jgi:hypothetical protein
MWLHRLLVASVLRRAARSDYRCVRLNAVGRDKAACGPRQLYEEGSLAVDASAIAKHMVVIAFDGVHVGVVDHVDGDVIRLMCLDSAVSGAHYFIPLDWVEAVAHVVRLRVRGQDAVLIARTRALRHSQI